MALSTTKAKYNACSKALQNVIPVINLLKEAVAYGTPMASLKTKVICQLFCDNSSTCELICLPKMRPRTKHINTKLHHFWENVAKVVISIQQVSTNHQLADVATKPLLAPLFSKFCQLIQGC